MNSINENVAELQKITHIQDTYYPYLEILYYEEMRDQIDNEAALEALKKELEKLLNNSDEQQINCNTLEKYNTHSTLFFLFDWIGLNDIDYFRDSPFFP